MDKVKMSILLLMFILLYVGIMAYFDNVTIYASISKYIQNVTMYTDNNPQPLEQPLVGNGTKRKNVLLLCMEGMRPEIGAYYEPGSPIYKGIHTPYMDDLASRSLRLNHAYVQYPICAPSRQSMLTGRRPDTTHVYDIGQDFGKVGGNFTTLEEYFEQNGYTTIGLGFVSHLRPERAKSLWMNSRVPKTKPKTKKKHDLYWHRSKNESWVAVSKELRKQHPLPDDGMVNSTLRALREYASSPQTKPFLLAAGFLKPHLPYICPEEYFKLYPLSDVPLPSGKHRFATDKIPKIAWSAWGELRGYLDIKNVNISHLGRPNVTLPDSKVIELRRAYYACVSYIDDLTGKILEELKRLELEDNTIIALWSDHGIYLGEHGRWAKHSITDLATRIPLMLHIPGVTDSGIVSNQVVEAVDIFPTLVEAVGLKPVPICPEESSQVATCVEGSSFLSLIPSLNTSNKIWKDRAFCQYRKGRMGYSMRTSQYRITEWVKFNETAFKGNWKKVVATELYDYGDGHIETVNVADNADYKNILDTLRLQLHQGWRKAGLLLK